MGRFFLIAVCCTVLLPHAVSAAAGTTSAAFLRLQTDARTAAMGETGAACSDVSAVFNNPAGLSATAGGLTFSHASWLGETSFQSAAFARKVSGGTGGIGVISLGVPAMQRFDNTGLAQPGDFSARDTAVLVSYARVINHIPFGATLKYITSTIDGTSASTFAADLGAHFPFKLAGRAMTGGVVIRNLGPGQKFSREAFPLPLTVRAGLSFNTTRDIEIDLDVDKGLGLDPAVHLGAEYRYPFGAENGLSARLGYRSGVKGVEGLAGLTTGVGVELGGFEVDYAFIPYGDLDQTHRLSLNYNF